MKMRPPAALTSQSLAREAGRKARRVQAKLHEAEEEIRNANEELTRGAGGHGSAAQHNVQAERKVHEAVEELEIVKTMLEDAEEQAHHRPAVAGRGGGASGHGVKSLLPHLQRPR